MGNLARNIMSKGNKEVIKGNKQDLKAVIWPFSQTHQDKLLRDVGITCHL